MQEEIQKKKLSKEEINLNSMKKKDYQKGTFQQQQKNSLKS